MKLGAKIFLSFLLIVCLCLYYPLRRLAGAIITHYGEGVEDALADQANILAGIVEREIKNNSFSPEQWHEIFDGAHNRALAARIYELKKERVDSHIYVTDKQGIVRFDSEYPENEGKDFSQWRDVNRTLQGVYGARTTRRDESDETSSVLYVAAPIMAGGEIAGVLTVVKPSTNIRYFVEGARWNILKSGIFSLIVAGVLSLLVAIWITRPIKRLTRYAKGISDNERPEFPRLDNSEIGAMGRAFAEMQEALEGRRYVEQYVEHLTHELKSPLSAIRGAAELLNEAVSSPKGMDIERQARFISNINGQSKRIQDIVDRMLELASLESRSYRRSSEDVDIGGIIREVCLDKEPLLIARGLTLDVRSPERETVKADGFLLRQALANLVQNAIDFSPDGGTISITADIPPDSSQATFTIADQGPGIPDYAENRVFDKFFSLQRPHTGQKSTGLGLNFVAQVALLHGGKASLANGPHGGAVAILDIRAD